MLPCLHDIQEEVKLGLIDVVTTNNAQRGLEWVYFYCENPNVQLVGSG